jgi:hypothetical protein
MDETWLLHYTPIDSPASGLNALNRIQSVARRNWQGCGIRILGQTINSEYNIGLFERLNDEIKKMAPFEEKKSAVSSRPCTVSQINQNNGKIA